MENIIKIDKATMNEIKLLKNEFFENIYNSKIINHFDNSLEETINCFIQSDYYRFKKKFFLEKNIYKNICKGNGIPEFMLYICIEEGTFNYNELFNNLLNDYNTFYDIEKRKKYLEKIILPE